MKSQESDGSAGRVTVMRGSQRVPLMAARHGEAPARQQPWKDVVLERHVVRAGEIPEHEHPSLCLHLQLTGSEDFEWWQDGKNAVERTRPGSLIVIPAGTRDRLHWEGASERLILSVESPALERVASELGAGGEIRGSWSASDASLRLLIEEMGREAGERWPLGALYADLLALGLETSLLRNHATERMPAARRSGGLGLARLRRAMEYMTSALAEDVGLEQIAGEMGMSASHFAHEFRRSTGATPYQYLVSQRLERARHLLRHTRLPVQTIAVETGFPYAANFTRTFRQRVGQSPEAWRREQTR